MSIATLDTSAVLRVRNVLNGTWHAFSANFGFFFTIALIYPLSGLLFPEVGPQGDIDWSNWPAYLAAGVLSGVLGVLGWTAIIFGAFEHLRGRPVQLVAVMQKALARFFPVLVLSIVSALGITLGMLLLFVPGLMLAMMWSVATPACVIEGLGPIESLGRSRALTDGYRWKIFGLLVLLLIVAFIVLGVMAFVAIELGTLVATALNLILNACLYAFGTCMISAIYHDLRVAKEGAVP